MQLLTGLLRPEAPKIGSALVPPSDLIQPRPFKMVPSSMKHTWKSIALLCIKDVNVHVRIKFQINYSEGLFTATSIKHSPQFTQTHNTFSLVHFRETALFEVRNGYSIHLKQILTIITSNSSYNRCQHSTTYPTHISSD